MIALISIPHRKPARTYWHTDRAELEAAALDYANRTDRPEPEDFDDAVHCLADDWNGHLLVESADDLPGVLAYARGDNHQSHRVAALVAEIREQFGVYPSADDQRKLGSLATQDDAGTHFTALHSGDWLRDMEMLGWIEIYRPLGGAGTPCCQENWSVTVDGEVANWFDANGNLIVWLLESSHTRLPRD